MPFLRRWDGVLACSRGHAWLAVLTRCCRGGVLSRAFAFSEALLPEVARSSSLGLQLVPDASDSVRATLSGSSGARSSGRAAPCPPVLLVLLVERPGGFGGVAVTPCHTAGLDVPSDMAGASFGVAWGVRVSADLVDLYLDEDSAANEVVALSADFAGCSLDEASLGLSEPADPAGLVIDVNLDRFCSTSAPEVVPLFRCGAAPAVVAVAREGGGSFRFEPPTVRPSWEALLARVGKLSRRDTSGRPPECGAGAAFWEGALAWLKNRGRVGTYSTEVDVRPVSFEIIGALPLRKVRGTGAGEPDNPRWVLAGFVGADTVDVAGNDSSSSFLTE